MTTERHRERLAEETRASLMRFRKAREAAQANPTHPGTLWVLAPTGDWPIEWAFLEAVGTAEAVLAPVDRLPMVGSTDLRLDDGELVLRCGATVAIPLRALTVGTGAKVTGRLPDAAVHRAREILARLETGVVDERATALETDLEPDYQDWLGQLRDARSALRAAQIAEPPSHARRRPSRLAIYRLAASVLLVTSLGLGAALVRIRAAPPIEPPLALTNLPLTWISADGPVRAASSINLEFDGSSHALLILQIDDPSFSPSYRVELHSAAGELAWSGDGLTRVGASELTLVLSRDLLRPGRYSLDVYPSGGDMAEPVERFDLVVDGEPEPKTGRQSP